MAIVKSAIRVGYATIQAGVYSSGLRSAGAGIVGTLPELGGAGKDEVAGELASGGRVTLPLACRTLEEDPPRSIDDSGAVGLENTGWLPSYVTKKALERKAVRPVIAEIELPEGAVLETGKPREELGQLEGRAYQVAGGFGGVADPTDERAKVEWVIRAPAGTTVRVTARHERAGTVRREGTLP